MLVAGDVLTCVNAMEEGGCTGILLVADVRAVVLLSCERSECRIQTG